MGKKLTDEQIVQRKQMREACDELYRKLSAFFTGRPPQSVISGSASSAIEYKDLICEARKIHPVPPTRGDYLEKQARKVKPDFG